MFYSFLMVSMTEMHFFYSPVSGLSNEWDWWPWNWKNLGTVMCLIIVTIICNSYCRNFWCWDIHTLLLLGLGQETYSENIKYVTWWGTELSEAIDHINNNTGFEASSWAVGCTGWSENNLVTAFVLVLAYFRAFLNIYQLFRISSFL